MISVIIPNKNRMIIVRPPNIAGQGKVDGWLEIGDGRITRGLAITLPTGTGVGVGMLLGVIPSSIANTSART
jgi:hypothetical protein